MDTLSERSFYSLIGIMSAEDETNAAEELKVDVVEPASGVKRERKQTNFFTTKSISPTPKKDISFTEGLGTALVENEKFCKGLDKLKWDDELVKNLHILLYGVRGKGKQYAPLQLINSLKRLGKKADTKKNIRKFSGFPADTQKDDLIAKISAKKSIWTLSSLKALADMFNLEKGGSKDNLIERVVTFLMCPSLVEKSDSSQKRPRSASKSPKAKRSKKSSKDEKTDDDDGSDVKVDKDEKVDDGDAEETAESKEVGDAEDSAKVPEEAEEVKEEGTEGKEVEETEGAV